MTIQIQAAQVYKTVDGKPHDTHKDAVQHGKFLQRIDNVKALDLSAGVYISKVEDGLAVFVDDIPALLALHADKIIAALDVRQTRNRKVAA